MTVQSALSYENPDLSDMPPPLTTTPEPAPSPAPPAKRRPRLWGFIALGLSVVVLFIALATSGDDELAPEGADIPRLEDNRIVFSESFKNRIELGTEEVRSEALTPVVSAVGMVTFNPKYVARVGTRLRGLVRTVNYYEGDDVEKGKILAEIDSPELGEAQAQVTMLMAQAQAAARDAARERDLVEKNLTTAREAEEAATEQSTYESLLRAARQKVSALAGGEGNTRGLGVHVITAPLSGTVVERKITQGELVEGNHVAFLIADLDHLWVELDVFEQSLPKIQVDDEVEVKPLNNIGSTIKGRVAQVGAFIDPATRSATVRIEIDNSQRLLRPGQAVDAKIRSSNTTLSTASLISAAAITYVDGEPTVFVLEDELSVRPTVVELGDGNGSDRQILKGLEPGQRVVVQGVFELKSELFR